MVDARLADGSRVNAIIPPLALDGPLLSIRRFAVDPLVEGQGDAYACFAVNQPITLQMRYGMQEGRDYVVTPWADLGMPGYANMLFAPRSAVREQFDANGLIAVGSAATEFAAYLKSENARWAPIIRATGAKVD